MVFLKTLSKFLIKKSDSLVICGWLQGKQFTWNNDQLFEEANYVNDQRHRLYRSWYDNGKILCESNYVNDQRHRLYRTWYSDGQI
jgi:hypothetical protein